MKDRGLTTSCLNCGRGTHTGSTFDSLKCSGCGKKRCIHCSPGGSCHNCGSHSVDAKWTVVSDDEYNRLNSNPEGRTAEKFSIFNITGEKTMVLVGLKNGYKVKRLAMSYQDYLKFQESGTDPVQQMKQFDPDITLTVWEEGD